MPAIRSEPRSGPPPRLVLAGRPGSGKGTQAALLAERLDLAAISMGDLLRALAGSDAPRGTLARRYLESGRLVPDRLVIELVREHVDAAADRGTVFDGYPRTRPQAAVLDHLLEPAGIDLVVELHVDADTSRERLAARARSDDVTTALDHRLRSFDLETAPMLEHFRRSGRLVRVDARAPVTEVHEAVLGELAATMELPERDPAVGSLGLTGVS